MHYVNSPMAEWLTQCVVVIMKKHQFYKTSSGLNYYNTTYESLCHWRIYIVKLYSLMLSLSKISYLGFINFINFFKCTMLIRQWRVTDSMCCVVMKKHQFYITPSGLNYYNTTYESLCNWWINIVKLYSLMLPLSKISYLGFINFINFFKMHYVKCQFTNGGVTDSVWCHSNEETPILHNIFWSSITTTPHMNHSATGELT